MSRREIFAENLRELCERKGNVSAMCRDMAINRQQFSRYLSGKTIPEDNNLEKIARYFGVTISELFSRELDNEFPVRELSSRSLTKALDLMRSNTPVSLDSGIYFATFAFPGEERILVRTVIAVDRDGPFVTFRRFTASAERSDSWWRQYNGNHYGLVLERRSFLHFIALNDLGNREPSLLTVRWAMSELDMFVGRGFIVTPLGPTIAPVVITKTALPLKQALRRCRTYRPDHPEIEVEVDDLLKEEGEALVQMVRHLDLRVRPKAIGDKTRNKQMLTG